MVKSNWVMICVLVGLMLLTACGPDTIMVRPGLDTPSQHVLNGHQLLERGKPEDACREFMRAKELDPHYAKAYVGLGLALGYKGEFQKGMETMDQAKAVANNADDLAAVEKGYGQLKKMQQERQ